jgi:hypothetical protein
MFAPPPAMVIDQLVPLFITLPATVTPLGTERTGAIPDVAVVSAAKPIGAAPVVFV